MNKIHCKLTKEGLEQLKAKKTILEKRLAEIDTRMDEVSLGLDVTEDLEFQELRMEMVGLRDEIGRLSNVIQNTKVISQTFYDKAQPGCRVNLGNHQICYMFQLVSTYEANPLVGKISCSSPLGNSLIGKRVGETVSVCTPRGKIDFDVVAIE